MAEKVQNIKSIEKHDIKLPHLKRGETALIVQRHERYDRNKSSDNVGSLEPEDAANAHQRDLELFRNLFEDDQADTYLLFVSSPTQYAGMGRRSMETTQIAQDAAMEVMEETGIDAYERIINLNPNFRTNSFSPTDGPRRDIRPDTRVQEPGIFDNPDFINGLRATYGTKSDTDNGPSQKAWAAYEEDTDDIRELREKFGIEGVHDIVARTKDSLRTLERYSRVFHANNPDKRLVVVLGTHYDTISPLVKLAAGDELSDYTPVDYGAGIVIELRPGETPEFTADDKTVQLHLGKVANTGL